MSNPIRIGIVDDHTLFRRGIAELVERFDGCTVAFELNNGLELQQFLTAHNLPDVLLLDVNMPELDGPETTSWVVENYPEVRILILSMYDNERTIIRALKAGAHGYLLKDANPKELMQAIRQVKERGYYHSEVVSQALIGNLKNTDAAFKEELLNEKEIEFIQFACSELTYKEIASKMKVTPRTIDGYREALFEKLQVKSRVGLVMLAIKARIIEIQ